VDKARLIRWKWNQLKAWAGKIVLRYTLKPRFNESEGTKDFVFYSRDFVIAGAFYYKINYRGTWN
jgi:hypothetical protein